ncbi:DUF1294 domain-containing protein [Actomonas aquatica]|uniref:DUF1294 domain-containing protein n=1 Tax=Actomonas aquatica TaxID=2866162 RepID=A0ABZ1C4V1_9BACT|nr:DUF1294 domain-containing protein [Opitutus sp. WL0086]WRQ86417.1 DUF1294 domain-containing protein [Opitutus sp. WL0086]
MNSGPQPDPDPDPEPPPGPPRLLGRITDWNDERGFGYLTGTKGKVFVHIRDFADRVRRPRIGDKVHYTMGTDKHGRTCAVDVVQDGFGGSFGIGSLLVLAALLILPVQAAHGWLEPDHFWMLMGVAATVSLVCFAAYYYDKSCAREGLWRVPENVLHILELLGGWPGAFIAQRLFRHKSAKGSYLFTYWAIVLLYQAISYDGPRGWPLFHAAKTWLRDLTS